MSYRTKLKETNYENQNNNEKYNTKNNINTNNMIENNYKEKNLDDVIKSFEYFDINKNGKIPIPELKRVLSYFGDKMTEDEIIKIFRTFGIEGNNKENIDYMQFINFLINNKLIYN